MPLIPPLFAGCRDSDKNATLCTDFIFPTHSMLDTQATCVSVSVNNATVLDLKSLTNIREVVKKNPDILRSG